MQSISYQSFLFVWQYVTYVTGFISSYLLLNSLNDTSKGILFHFRTDFCVNRHKNTSFSTIEFFGSY